jgi:class 3 adenylate cyclase/tetratricopeptide (TPR) repeat protein
MRCDACGTENPADRKFCGGCGTALARACPSCGAPNEAKFAFCGECGSLLDVTAAVHQAEDRPAPKAERRLVSVLFADLVGFTTISEARDAEEVRELLSRYFEECRARIVRYGGTVEKFIGDAVMAVWGAPVANEDDAERAVRAALDVVEAVRALGEEIGVPGLAARAGVLTGEAAVNLGATAEGLVAGDLVNTASRVQSIAAPGTVLVDAATRRATDAAIAYEEAGSHELKGKVEAVPVWRALRVVAGVGGAQKSVGLEAPFVGRSRELGLVKDLLHASIEQRGAHLTSIVGQAGIGKSRLGWELFKYVDGLTEVVWWHRGRCLAYGEGVTYWALAEMIRGRAGIREDEGGASAAAKLAAVVDEFVPDPAERRWVYPRLAGLLGLEDQRTSDATDLFSGWRMFFERMAEQSPVLLVFEDLQWADAALLDFVEYLLDWSRGHRIYVVTLARPELVDKRPTWGAARRNVTSLALEPLADEAMDELLAGLVPGLAPGVRDRIRERAEGVPLYAVETVRMLVDRGALRREGDRYVPVGEVADLEVPETLQALIAGRLDALSQVERSLLQKASVLGKTFPPAALAAVSDTSEDELQPLLVGLVRKELLGVQADPRSPERGQYGFLQSLVQKVAHDTLSRRDRKALHLGAAAYLQQNWAAEEGEVVQVIAAHYLDAYLADPAATDAQAIREDARDFLTRAGERAAGLAAQEEAQRYFLRAAQLTSDEAIRADLMLQAGIATDLSGRIGQAEPLLREAVASFQKVGDVLGEARATKDLALLLWRSRMIDEGVSLLEHARASLPPDAPPELRAELAASLGRVLFFNGRLDDAMPALEEALELAEAHRLLAVLSDAMNSKALVLLARSRWTEGRTLLEGALRVAEESGVAAVLIRAYGNLAYTFGEGDLFREGLQMAETGIELARRVGDRDFEWFLQSSAATGHTWLGEWDEALQLCDEVTASMGENVSQLIASGLLTPQLTVWVGRGELDHVEPDELAARADSSDVQERGMARTELALLLAGRGEHTAACETARLVIVEDGPVVGIRHPNLRAALPIFVGSALASGQLDAADELVRGLEAMPYGHLSPFLRGHLLIARARIDDARGITDGVEAGLRTAVRVLEEHELVFHAAQARGHLAEWLAGQGRRSEAEQTAEQALAALEALGARPWVERLAPLRSVTATA